MRAHEVPDAQHAEAATTPEADANATDGAALAAGGDVQIERMLDEGGGGDDPGLQTYQDALGMLIGGPLYKAVSDAVTPAELHGHAMGAFDDFLKAFGKTLNAEGAGLGKPDQAKLEAGVSALKKELRTHAEAFLQTEPGQRIKAIVSDFVGAEPWVVASALLLAAVAGIAANVDTGKLATSMSLGGGFKAKGDVELGRIRALALGSVSTTLQYEKGKIKAEASGQLKKPEGGGAHQLHYGAALEFKDLDAIRSFIVSYKHDHVEGVPIDEFRATMLIGIAKVSAEAKGQVTLRPDAEPAGQVGANAKVPVNRDLTLTGGVAQGFGNGAAGTTATFGVQLPKFNANVGYDMSKGTWQLTLSMPIGGK